MSAIERVVQGQGAMAGRARRYLALRGREAEPNYVAPLVPYEAETMLAEKGDGVTRRVGGLDRRLRRGSTGLERRDPKGWARRPAQSMHSPSNMRRSLPSPQHCRDGAPQWRRVWTQDSPSPVFVMLVSLLGMSCGIVKPKSVAVPATEGSMWMVASAWEGTGLLAPSGGVTSSATQVVRIAYCRVVPKPLARRWGQVDETPPPHTFSVLAIDDECIIAATHGLSFVPKEDQTCTLVVGGLRRAIRVTDVAAHYSPAGYTRYGTAVLDSHELEVRLGGDDVASGKHMAYEFSGRTIDEVAAPAICSSVYDPWTPNAP